MLLFLLIKDVLVKQHFITD